MANNYSKGIHLHKKTAEFIDNLAKENSKPINKLSPNQARQVLIDLQSKYPTQTEADIIETNIFTKIADNVSIRIIRPKNNTDKLPVILYFHGGGWVLGNKQTHDELTRKLANITNSVVIFLEYSLSPEVIYPVAITQDYAVLDYIFANPDEFNIDENKIALAGDSAGGNIAIVTALQTKHNNGPKISFTALFYPVTDADMKTKSYEKFKNGPWLTKKSMEWFWDAYVPDKKLRKDPYISPLKAEINDLKNFPSTLIITAENDVLRDEGEAFARKLDKAGVNVLNIRINGTIHDFMMLNALSQTEESKGAFLLAGKIISENLHY